MEFLQGAGLLLQRVQVLDFSAQVVEHSSMDFTRTWRLGGDGDSIQ